MIEAIKLFFIAWWYKRKLPQLDIVVLMRRCRMYYPPETPIAEYVKDINILLRSARKAIIKNHLLELVAERKEKIIKELINNG